MIARSASAIAVFCSIFSDQAFEVIQLAIRHEYSGRSPFTDVANIQQLDPGAFTSQALERQFDLRKAFEFDLQPQALAHPDGLLGLHRRIGGWSKQVDLPL